MSAPEMMRVHFQEEVRPAPGRPAPAPLEFWRSIDGKWHTLRHGRWMPNGPDSAVVLVVRDVPTDFFSVVRWAARVGQPSFPKCAASLTHFLWTHGEAFILDDGLLRRTRYEIASAALKAWDQLCREDQRDLVVATPGAPLTLAAVLRVRADAEDGRRRAQEQVRQEEAARVSRAQEQKLARLRELMAAPVEALTAEAYAERMRLRRELKGAL